MAGLADFFLKQATQPQNTGYLGAYNQGQQQAYGRGLSGALASGAPRAEVMSKASYVDPMGALKMQEAQANAQAMGTNKNSQDPTLLKNVNSLGVQYRSYLDARYSKEYNQMSPQAQQQLNQSIEGIRQIMSRSELGRALLGQAEQEAKAEVGVQEQTSTQQTDTNQIKEEGEALTSQLIEGAIDKNRDGIIDDIVSMKRKVSQFATKYGNTNEAKEMAELLDNLVENVSNKYDASVRKSERSRAISKDYASDLPAHNYIAKVENGTATMGDKTLGAGFILKYLSGAGVSDSERINTMLALTSPEYAEKFRAEGKGIGKALFKEYIVNNEQEIMNEITRNASAKIIADQLGAFVTKGSKKWFKNTQQEKPKKTAGTATETPNATNKEPFDQEAFLNRLKGMSN
jgi:hypothetical protein